LFKGNTDYIADFSDVQRKSLEAAIQNIWLRCWVRDNSPIKSDKIWKAQLKAFAIALRNIKCYDPGGSDSTINTPDAYVRHVAGDVTGYIPIKPVVLKESGAVRLAERRSYRAQCHLMAGFDSVIFAKEYQQIREVVGGIAPHICQQLRTFSDFRLDQKAERKKTNSIVRLVRSVLTKERRIKADFPAYIEQLKLELHKVHQDDLFLKTKKPGFALTIRTASSVSSVSSVEPEAVMEK
jgi:hypothetical protein